MYGLKSSNYGKTFKGHVTNEKIKIIYYAHPTETFNTGLEKAVVSSICSFLGDVYHINDWRSLCDALTQKTARQVRESLRQSIKRYIKGEMSKKGARSVGLRFLKEIKGGFVKSSHLILFNPSIFENLFPETCFPVTKLFKKRTYPDFCYGLIDGCDMMVAHGYPLNSRVKQAFRALLSLPSSPREVTEYASRLLRLIDGASDMVWSPGAFEEVKYALERGLKVFKFHNGKLEKISTMEGEVKVPFDDYCLRLYSKIWQPIAEVIYWLLYPPNSLTELRCN